jgi:hypothetical protein
MGKFHIKNQTTIAISRKNRDAIRNYGRAGDTTDDIIRNLLDIANRNSTNMLSAKSLLNNAQGTKSGGRNP